MPEKLHMNHKPSEAEVEVEDTLLGEESHTSEGQKLESLRDDLTI